MGGNTFSTHGIVSCMQYSKYLKWACIGLISIIFLVPFIVADGQWFPAAFFPYITGKNFAFRILVEMLLACYLLLAMLAPEYRPKRSGLMLVLLAFVAWMGIATVFSVDPGKSFWSNFERMEGYVSLLHFFAYTVITSAVVSAAGCWRSVMRVVVGVSSVQALFGLFQLLHLFGFAPSSQSGARLDGTFGNAAYLAVYMLFSIFTTLYLLVVERRNSTANVLYGVALVLQVVVLFGTQTRSALIGVVGGILLAALLVIVRSRGSNATGGVRKLAVILVATVVVLVGSLYFARNTSFVQNQPTLQRFAAISLTDRTTASRFAIWHMALRGFADKPVTGWGQENFSYVFNTYYEPSMYNQEAWFDRAHNAFLDWLIAGGLPAFLLYVGVFFMAVRAILRSTLEVPAQAVLVGMFAGYAANNMLVFDNLTSYLFFFFMVAFTMSLTPRKDVSAAHASSRVKGLSDHAFAIAAPIVLVSVFLVGWSLNAPSLARAENLLVAMMPSGRAADGTVQPKDAEIALEQFKKAFSKETTWPGFGAGQQETAEQMMQYLSEYVFSSQNTANPEVRIELYNTARSYMDHMIIIRPHDARLELFMGTFLDAAGKPEEATKYLKMALEDSPRKQAILFESGISAVNRNATQEGIGYLKTAFEGAPEFDMARLIYASVLFYSGDKVAADALLIEKFGTVLVDDQRLMQVYINAKQFDRVIGIWEKRIGAQPDNAELYIGLASTYFAQNNKTKSIEALRHASTINPTLSAQINGVIEQIENGTLKMQ